MHEPKCRMLRFTVFSRHWVMNEVPADGNVSIVATVSGTIENPAADLSVSATDLQAYSEPFGTLSVQAHVENQVLQLDDLSLNKAEGEQLQASGRYDLTSGTYDIKADGRELKLNRVVLPQGTTIRANLSVNAEGSGTLENPGGVLKLSVRDLQIDEESVGSIDLNANVADHQARITSQRSGLWGSGECLCRYRASISRRARNPRYRYGYLTLRPGKFKGVLGPRERNCKCVRGPQ